MAALEVLDISAYRAHIVAALSYSGDTHQYDDVVEMITAGRAHYWPGPGSVVVTEIVEHPRESILHYFLAAGTRRELQRMEPLISQWGRTQGCSKATLIGRKGWQRTFLKAHGWTVSDLIVMEKPL
jgi:hypothetical protein